MSDSTFQSYYDKLNTEQKEAVDTLEGPVMVIAGPGTGKTRALTLRIANIVRRTDTEPENILALTFTEAGVISMRKALIEIMGADAYAVDINTFHGFSNGIIKNYPECFPRIIGSEAITDSERVKILEEVIESLSLKQLRPTGDKFHYLRDIIKAISDLKREGVDTKDYEEIISEWRYKFDTIDDLYYKSGQFKGKMRGKYTDEAKNIIKNEDLVLVYASYEEKLAEKKLYDYEDMIMETLKALRMDNNLLLSLQEKYQYILADEHQDSNKAQNRILELLASFHDNPNIFIVGDSKQAIFRFQGASLDNFYYFKNLYPGAKLISLKNNYRSTEEILAGAYSLIPRDEEIISQSGKGNKIKIYSFESELAEEYFIADEIKRKITAGENPREIAVLFRENKDGTPLAIAFAKYGIPFVIESDNNLLADYDVRKLIQLMKAVADPDNQFALAEAMHMSFFRIEPFEIYKALNEARKERVHIAEIIKNSSEEKIKSFSDKISAWKIISKNEGLMETIEAIITGSDILKEIMKSPDALTRIEKVTEFYSHIRDFAEKKKAATFDDFISHLETMESYSMTIAGKRPTFSEGKVRLMTAHRSKGQEFGSVYIVRAIDSLWGNKKRAEKLRLPYKVYSLSGRIQEDDEKIDDERKLFYVAVTRAKKELTITYGIEGRGGKEQLPTGFIKEIREDMREDGETAKWNTGVSAHMETLFSPAPAVEPEEEIKKLVIATLEEKGLSATDINNYLNCPWKYFYTGLFRIPERKEPHLVYGNAVHGALKDFFNSIKEHGARKEYLLVRFEYYLSREAIKERDYEVFLKKGKNALSVYFEEYKQDWDKDFYTEFEITGVEISPRVMIKGRIDRMDKDGFSNNVIVTDFKTGKAKTKGEIEGKTKKRCHSHTPSCHSRESGNPEPISSGGEIKRQLVFYKLLLNGYKSGKYKMIAAQIDFVEPDEKGRCKRQNIIVTQEESDILKAEIIRIANEIRSLVFWNQKCDDKSCPYCKLRE